MQTLDAENWCKGESVHILFFEYSFNVLIEKKLETRNKFHLRNSLLQCYFRYCSQNIRVKLSFLYI